MTTEKEGNQIQKADPNHREVSYRAFGSDEQIALTIHRVQQDIARPTKSGARPTRADCVRFIMLCRAQRLNPWERDVVMVGYDGKDGPVFEPITTHPVVLKRAEASPNFNGLESGIIIQDEEGAVREIDGAFYTDHQKLLGGWARVHLKNLDFPRVAKIRLQARAKDTPFWRNDAAGQIQKCAEAEALRRAFPSILGDLRTEDEGAVIDISPAVETPNATIEPGDGYGITIAGDRGPTQEKASAETPHHKFQALLDEHGISFDAVQQWGENTGNIEDASSYGSLDEIHGKVLERLLRSKTGLIKGLKQAQETLNSKEAAV